MCMAVGDTTGTTRELRRVRPTAADDVRDFDQLPPAQQREFLCLRRGEGAEAALPAGTVIRFTDYYRVERA
jgi:hypothetical protein